MNQALINKWFSLSSGLILLITGAAKIWSGLGRAHVLGRVDPILGLSFGHLMLLAGVLEIIVAGLCLAFPSKTLPLILVAWLATNLLAYRLGLWWLGWQRPCNCLGAFTDAIHLSPHVADTLMKAILAYLLIGSYAVVIWRRLQKQVPH